MKINKVEKYELNINGYNISLSKNELQELHTLIGNTLGTVIKIPSDFGTYPSMFGDGTDMIRFTGAAPVDTITLTSNYDDISINLGEIKK